MLLVEKCGTLVLLSLFLVPVAAAQQETEGQKGQNSETPTRPTAEETADPEDQVAVTIDGHEIMESRVHEVFRDAVQQQTRGRNLPEAQLEQLRKQWEPRILESLIGDYLMNEQVEQKDISLSDEEFVAEFEQEVQAYLARNRLTREEFEQQFEAQQQMSLSEFIKNRAADPRFRQAILQAQLLEKEYPELTSVTQEEIKARYERDLERAYSQPPQVKASHILIKADQTNTEEEKEAARKKIETVLEQAKEEGADFAELAKEHSEGPSSVQGGDLGYFPRHGKMVEPFAAAAFELKEGEISGIVETRFGYHIIKVTDRKEAETVPLKEVAPVIREELKAEKIALARERLVEKLRDQAEIVYGDEAEAPMSGSSEG